MRAKETRRTGNGRARLARTEKELKAELTGSKKPKKIVLPVKVAKIISRPMLKSERKNRATFEVLESKKKDVEIEFKTQDEHAILAVVDRQKRFIILSGVTFFMVIIAVLWVFSLSAGLKASRIELSSRSGLENLTGELSKELDRIRGELESSSLPSSHDYPMSNVGATSTPIVIGTSTQAERVVLPVNPEILERLKDKLE